MNVIWILATALAFGAAHAGPRRHGFSGEQVNSDLASLVHAEARLLRAGGSRRDFYEGTYRRPGEFEARNLRGLKASALDLRYFRFRNADLRAANFYRADLSHADLRGADLRNASLVSARLTDARVSERTQLPISIDEARARGVTWAKD